jgi:ubiquinone/menaquinone biosynthesis C-methylase UbiE
MPPPSSVSVRRYWDAHIHDLGITTQPPGSSGFFADLDAYHFEKLHHLPRFVDFDGWRGRMVLDVGCGAGVEVVRFARGGARTVGVDVSERAIRLTRQNLTHHGIAAALSVADAEALPFADRFFDFVYAHGVIQYAADDKQVVAECHRVLRPGGRALFQVYNRISWLQLLSTVMRVPLEHEDAPVLRRYSAREFRAVLRPFASVTITAERFPVKSRLHKGWKGAVFNAGFVGTFNALPRAWVRRFGWHLLAECRK